MEFGGRGVLLVGEGSLFLVVVFLLVDVAEEGCVVDDSFDGDGFFFLVDADVEAEAESPLHEEYVGFRW